MNDCLLRAMTKDGQMRIYAALTTSLVQKASDIHNMNPTPAVALGRTLTAAAMMSGTLKDHGTITLQIKGEGPIGGIVVVTDAKARVRGYVHNPCFDLPFNAAGKFDIAGAIGKGYLNVITDLGLKEPYVGYVDLVSGEIAEDITYYYAHSEQTPTVTALGVLVGREGKIINAGGLFIQLMPGCDEETISWLESSIEKMPPVTKLLESHKPLEELMQEILPGKELIFLDTKPIEYQCNCSRERMERNLVSLGKEELESLAADQEEAELVCHFCETRYTFHRKDIEGLLQFIEKKEELSE